MKFQKATKAQSKARIALIGISGSGKTYTALKLAAGLGHNVALIDTENSTASKYADEFDFSTLSLTEFSPQNYIDAILAAESAGFDVLIIDSISHAWMGKGGALEMVDTAAKRSKSQNTFVAWREVTPLHNAMVDALVQCKMHLIVTMRAKADYVMVEKGGKTVPQKIGLAPIQREGLEYEFDIVGDLDLDHNLVISKTRCRALDGAVISKPNGKLAETINAWLTDGVKLYQTVDDLLYAIGQATGLAEADAKELLKRAGHKGFAASKSAAMYADAITQYNAEKQPVAVDQPVLIEAEAPKSVGAAYDDTIF